MLYLQVSTLKFLLWILYWVWKYFTYWILQVLISSLEHLCNIIFYKSHWQDSDFTRFKLLMFNWSLIISYYYYRYYHYYYCHYHYHYYYCYYYNHYCHCHYHYYFTSFNFVFWGFALYSFHKISVVIQNIFWEHIPCCSFVERPTSFVAQTSCNFQMGRSLEITPDMHNTLTHGKHKGVIFVTPVTIQDCHHYVFGLSFYCKIGNGMYLKNFVRVLFTFHAIWAWNSLLYVEIWKQHLFNWKICFK